MAEQVSLEELVVSTLAMSDAVAKRCVAKGVFTDEESKAQLGAEGATSLAALKRPHSTCSNLWFA